MLKDDSIVEYIRQNRILDEQTLQKLTEQHRQTGQSLVNIIKKDSLVSEDALAGILAVSNEIEFINLSPEMVDAMAAHMITHEMASHFSMIPVKKEGNKLFMAMSEPLNIVARDQAEMKTGCEIVVLAATPNAVAQAIRYHFDVRNATRQAIASMRLKQDTDKQEPNQSEHDIKKMQVSTDPVTKLVSSIIDGAIGTGASDIHIEPRQPDMMVRYRVDGLLRDAIEVPSSVQREVISHIKILADMDISERRMPQDGHIATVSSGREYDLRVSSLPAVGGEKIVIRILDKSSNKWSLDGIVTDAGDNKKFRSLVKNPYGMILLTGPTGSGKTTTLYSVLSLLNTPERNIVTVEDPVEYRLEGITQVQVKPIAGMTFASALRSILRQDPDIVLIGEIRDLETAEIAISAALTGHLVLSTLHTNDAAGAISRLVNLGVPPFLVASALLGTVAQRLIRTNCPKCRQQYSPSAEEIAQAAELSDFGSSLYRGAGCSYCYQSGYHGRKAIYEILSVSGAIRKMISDQASDDVIKQQAIKEGMKTLRSSGLEVVRNGKTTVDELFRLVDIRNQ